MDKTKCYCIVPMGLIADTHTLELIAHFKEIHNHLNVVVISSDDFKAKQFDVNREKIKLDSDLIMKAVKSFTKELIDSSDIFTNERKYIRNQNNLRERNFRPNFKYRK